MNALWERIRHTTKAWASALGAWVVVWLTNNRGEIIDEVNVWVAGIVGAAITWLITYFSPKNTEPDG